MTKTLEDIFKQAPSKAKPKRKKGVSKASIPRTIAWLGERHYTIADVQKYNAFSGQRSDMFGIFDLFAFDDTTCIGVQVCLTDVKGHITKMAEEHRIVLSRWLKHPSRKAMLFGWRKVKVKRGGKAMVIRARIFDFTLEDGVIVTQERKKSDEDGTAY